MPESTYDFHTADNALEPRVVVYRKDTGREVVAFRIKGGDIDTAERMALAWMQRAEKMKGDPTCQ